MAKVMEVQYLNIIKTTAQWSDASVKDTIIPKGLLCIELDENNKPWTKVGDGVNKFANLPYTTDAAIQALGNLFTGGDGITVNANKEISLDAATTNTLGGIIVGSNLSVNQNGVLSGDYKFDGVYDAVTNKAATVETVKINIDKSVYGLQEGIAIPSNTNLNTYNSNESCGRYYCTASNVSTITNKPADIVDEFRMDVFNCEKGIMQIIYPNTSDCLFFTRFYANNSWGDWIKSATSMKILSYGSSTWNDFIDAYNKNAIVYCRAGSSSASTPPQTRMAFMAYVNNDTNPTEVEFQYYRSVASHSDSQQGDQVFIYKLNKTSGWSLQTRNTFTKIVAGDSMNSSYSGGTTPSITLNHDDSGVDAGTYDTVTVNSKGHVTSGSNSRVSNIEYNTSSKKLTKTINGVTSDILSVDNTPSENSNNPVTSGGVYNFVNSSVEDNVANYIGTFSSVAELEAYSGTLTNNDYAFVTVGSGITAYNNVYQYKEGSEEWVTLSYKLYEPTFSTAQISTINSGLTASDKTAYNNHIQSTQNPHSVTKAQVGLGNVDNTSDLNKPISTAVQTELNKMVTDVSYNSTSKKLTKTINGVSSDVMVVDTVPSENSGNVVSSGGTYDFVNSSVATNTAYFIGTFSSVAELEAYTGTVTNNDYAFVTSVDSSGNTLYNRYKYNGSTQTWGFEYSLNNSSFTAAQWATIQSGLTAEDKATYNQHLASTNNPHGVTKSQVGLGNVDNTSDMNKPISTAVQTALDGKQSTISDLTTIRNGASLGATALQQSDVLSTYSASGTNPVNGTAIGAAFGTLNVSSVGGSGMFISQISEVNGKISATPTSFDTSLSTSSTHNTAPTSKAVYDAVSLCAGKKVEGTTYIIDGETVVAEAGAEVFNDAVIEDDGDIIEYSNIAVGQCSHAEGENTIAEGSSSHTEGNDTYASGASSHAEGSMTRATNIDAHAEGQHTEANGPYSHAEGYSTRAEGSRSHAEGRDTIAAANDQHVQGKYNISQDNLNTQMAFIIGNGTSTQNRSNAFAIDWDGNIYQGNSSVGANVMNHQQEINYAINTGVKNIVNNTASASELIQGVTWTKNDDGSMTANGTSSGVSAVRVVGVQGSSSYASAVPIPRGTYTVSASGFNVTKYRFALGFFANENASREVTNIYDEPYTFTVTSDTARYDFSCVVATSGETMSGQTWYPMIRCKDISDDTFQPYAPTNSELYNIKTNQTETNVVTNLGAKNLLRNTAGNGETKGITSVVNADGSITLNGTCTEDFYKGLVNTATPLAKGTYIISPTGIDDTKCFWSIGIRTTTSGTRNFTSIYNSPYVLSVTNDTTDYTFLLRFKQGVTFNGETIYPMIRHAEITDDTFQPYAPSNRELYEMILQLQQAAGLTSASLLTSTLTPLEDENPEEEVMEEEVMEDETR